MSNRCPACGGDLERLGNGGYRCVFCGHMCSDEDFRTTQKSIVTPMVSEGVDVYDMNINSVLEITWSDSQYRHSGSGFLISKSGYALTNTHVVTHENGQSCETVNVRVSGTNVSATVVCLGDDKHGDGNGVDLALIRLTSVPQNAKPVTFGDFSAVKNGEKIFVIGNSLGYGTCMTSGIVSDKLRNVNGKMLLMTDCAINGGNSGGPMFNEKGEVIAVIVSGITQAEGMNFAIPVSTVNDFLSQKCSTVKMGSGIFTGPETRKKRCPKCGNPDAIYHIKSGHLYCSKCGYSETPPRYFAASSNGTDLKGRKKALAPCPRCGSWETDVENGIFYCNNCGLEGG